MISKESVLEKIASLSLCTGNPDNVMLEVYMQKLINYKEGSNFCERLCEGNINFACSDELGFAKADCDNARIYVFKSGRVLMRQVKDKDTAYTILQQILKVFQ